MLINKSGKVKLWISLIVLLISLISIGGYLVMVEAITFTTEQVESLAVAVLDSDSVITVWCDELSDDIEFIISNIDGHVELGKTQVDDDVGFCDFTQVGVSAFNSSTYVIGWQDRDSSHASFAIYDNLGNVIVSETDVDTSTTSGRSISVSALNSTAFVIGWYDVTDFDQTFSIYDSSGNLLTGPIDVDTNAGSFSHGVSVSAFNSTDFVMAWTQDSGDDVIFSIYDVSGNLRVGPTTAINGLFSEEFGVSVATFDSDNFVIGTIGNEGDNVTFNTYDGAGNSLIGEPIVVDSEINMLTNGQVSVATLNSTSFVIGWHDNAGTSNSFVVYDILGNELVNRVNSSDTSTGFQALASNDSATGIALDEQRFVHAYTISTSRVDFTIYNQNGSIFTPPNLAPEFFQISNFALNEDFSSFTIDLSDNITDNDNDADLNFTWTNSDPTAITIVSIDNSTDILTFNSIANASGTPTINITVLDTSGLQDSTNFILTVNSVNDNPWSDAVSNPSSINEDSGLNNDIITKATLDNLWNDVEDAFPITYEGVQSQTNSSVVDCVMDVGNNIDCTTQANMSGTSDIVFRYSDSGSLYTELTYIITVDASNDAPWITTYFDNVTKNEDAGNFNAIVNADLKANFSDVEENNLPTTYELITSSNTSSTCFFDGSNNFNCNTLANLSSVDTYKLSMNDSSGLGAIFDYKVTINSVNDQPWIFNENEVLSNITLNEDFSNLADVINVADFQGNFSDVEENNAPTSITLISQTNTSSSCYLDGSSNVNCSSVSNQSSTDLYTFELNDSGNLAIRLNWQVIVSSVNDPHWIDPYNATRLNFTTPIQDIVNTSIEANENESLTFDVGIIDVETETHWYTWFLDGVNQLIDSTFNWFTYYFDFNSAKDSYNITVVVNDTLNQQVLQEWEVNISNILTASISGETVTPSTIYNNISAYLNSTINAGEGGLDTVWIELNFTDGEIMNISNFTNTFFNDGNTWSFYLDDGNFTNQDNRSYQWYANDTNGGEVVGTLGSIFIENRNATIESGGVSLTPDPAIDTDDLNCTITKNSYDYDGEEVNFYVQWYNNSVLESFPLDSWNVSSGNLTADDIWQCGVIPYDIWGNGTEVKSQTVQIGSSNSAPVLSQTNATTIGTTVISDSTNPTNNDSSITFYVGFTDDGDLLDDGFRAYFCKSDSFTFPDTCNGGTWASNESNLTENVLTANYDITDLSLSSYNYYAFVTDNQTVSSSLSGSFDVNHPPENLSYYLPLNNSKEATQGTRLEYTAQDTDGDTITYIIYIGNESDPSLKATTSLNYYNNSNEDITTYYSYIWARDEHNYYAVQNTSEIEDLKIYTVDYTAPNNTINASGYTSTTDGQQALIGMYQEDSTELDSCYYKLSALGSPVDYTNISCNSDINLDNTNLLVSEATYTVYVSANDTFGNENVSEIQFTTTKYVAPVSASPGGGGGGTPTSVRKGIGDLCETNEECETGICDLEFGSNNKTSETYQTCVTSTCGNNICALTPKRETYTTCRADCVPFGLGKEIGGLVKYAGYLAIALLLGITIFRDRKININFKLPKKFKFIKK